MSQSRPAVIAVSSLACLLFAAAFLLGFAWRGSTTNLGFLDPEYRRDEVDPMFARFQRGAILYHINVDPLNGCMLDVAVVDNASRGAEYGFVALKEPIQNYWSSKPEFKVYKYDKMHLFVILSDWFVNDYKRKNGAL